MGRRNAATLQFLNRIAAGNFAANIILLAYKKYTQARSWKKKVEGPESPPAPMSSSSSSSSSSPRLKSTSWQSGVASATFDAARVWAVGGLACAASRLLSRLLVQRAVVRDARLAFQFVFGAAASLLLQRLDPLRWRQGIFAGLCINSALGAAYALVFPKGSPRATRVGPWVMKAVMAVVGAQLSHAFILTPFSMSKSDLRFFRLASGHSIDRHEKVVRTTGGAMTFESYCASPAGAGAGAGAGGHASPASPPSPSSLSGTIVKDSKDDEEAPQVQATTFCQLVHPGQPDCMDAFLPTFHRAARMALLLYLPFLTVQLVRRIVVRLGMRACVCACMHACMCVCVCVCVCTYVRARVVPVAVVRRRVDEVTPNFGSAINQPLLRPTDDSSSQLLPPTDPTD